MAQISVCALYNFYLYLPYFYSIDLCKNSIVKIENSTSIVKDTLQKLIQRQYVYDSSNNIYNTYTENIIIYRKLSVELLDPKQAFTVTALHDSNTQVIDTILGNRWDWAITTNTDEETALLILKVKAEKPNGATSSFTDMQIPISIEIDNDSFFRRAWIYLLDHPEYIIGAILLPVFGFFAKRYFDKKDGSKKESGKLKEDEKPQDDPY